jgi:transcriptional regulator with XRE-family HTH domain
LEREFSLAKRLQVIRLERGLTLRQAEEMTGVDKDTISRIERAKRHPHGPTLARLAKGYGVPVADFIEEPAPLAEAPATGLATLDPWAMLAERDADRRAAVLKAATDEERERYVAELDDAIARVEVALSQDAANPPVAEDEKAAHTVRLGKLWELHNSYVILRHEAEPVVLSEPQVARELVPA